MKKEIDKLSEKVKELEKKERRSKVFREKVEERAV